MKIHTHHRATDPSGRAPTRPQPRNGHDRLMTCATVVTTVLATVLLAGCGGSSGNGGASGASGLAGYSHAELMAAAVKYSVCMRSHGLSDYPDPTLGSNGLPNWDLAGRGLSVQDPQSPQFQAAQPFCKHDIQIAPDTPAATVAANAKALKYAVCMRSHGEPDFPDPNGQGLIQITSATGILATNAPQYGKAQQACQSLDSGFGQSSSTAHASG